MTAISHLSLARHWCQHQNSISNRKGGLYMAPTLSMLAGIGENAFGMSRALRPFKRAMLPLLSPTNIFAPASTPAQSIFDLSRFVLMVTGAIFVVVFSLLAY